MLVQQQLSQAPTVARGREGVADDFDLGEVVALAEEALAALGETEAVHGGEERQEDGVEEEGEGVGGGGSGIVSRAGRMRIGEARR